MTEKMANPGPGGREPRAVLSADHLRASYTDGLIGDVTWDGGDLSEQPEEQLQGRGLVLAGTVGHRGRELLQQQNPHLDQTWRTQVQSDAGRARREKGPVRVDLVTCVVVKLLQDAVHPVLRADGALLRPHRQAGEPRPQEHRLGRHLVDLCQQLSIKQTLYVP